MDFGSWRQSWMWQASKCPPVEHTYDGCFPRSTREAIAGLDSLATDTSDQRARLTSISSTDVLKAAQIRVSMDGKGRWNDNEFIEWRSPSMKYEGLRRYAYGHAREAPAVQVRYFFLPSPASFAVRNFSNLDDA
jgi:putative transposase